MGLTSRESFAPLPEHIASNTVCGKGDELPSTLDGLRVACGAVFFGDAGLVCDDAGGTVSFEQVFSAGGFRDSPGPGVEVEGAKVEGLFSSQ